MRLRLRLVLPWLCLLLIKGAIAYVEAVAGSFIPPSHFEPQVAIYCGKQKFHNQYLDESGTWVSDLDPGAACTADKVQILDYCKKVYPKKDITNIVESSHFYKIENWCRYGQKKCRQAQWVKPYRCLEGQFQSDALLVPEHCLFDHVHNQSKCLEFDLWNQTAAHSCVRRDMVLRSFAMLLPCGIDVFSGVEFVCCPAEKETWKINKDGKIRSSITDTSKLARLEQVNSVDSATSSSAPSTTDPDEIDPDSSDDSSSDSMEPMNSSDESDEEDDDDDDLSATDATTTTSTTPDYYLSHFNAKREHEEFKAAERRLEDRHRERVTKVMKDWGELEEHYQEMKATDSRAAEAFKQNMTAKFQKTVAALEEQGAAEKKQLLALHQQRVLAAINEKKREGMECYQHSLHMTPPKTQKIQKCLEKLLRALEKDRSHAISHYKHLLNTNFRQAAKEKSATVERLAEIDRSLNQSLQMLDHVPEVAMKIKSRITEFLQSLRNNHHDVVPMALQSNRESEDALLEKYKAEVSIRQRERQRQKEMERQRKEEKKEMQEEEQKVATNMDGYRLDLRFDPETMEDEAALPSSPQQVVTETKAKVAHSQKDFLHHNEAAFQLTRDESHFIGRRAGSSAPVVTLGFLCFALLAAMLVSVALLRRRTNRSPHQQGFIEVDQAATPEERHVASMQVNGYENPTYKYFEARD